MKSLKDIENISFEELERIAADESVGAPQGLYEAVSGTVKAAGVHAAMKRKRQRQTMFVGIPAIAALAAAALFVLLPSDAPKDTFDDPLQAYAEVERIMGLISDRTDAGLAKTAKLSESVESISKVIVKMK